MYTGITRGIGRRVFEHKNSLIKGFTLKYNVNKLVYFEVYEFVDLAIYREKQIKGYSRNKKDWALVVKDSLYGFIRNDGVEIVSPKYESISPFGEYRKDWALVVKDGLHGFIRNDGVEIVSPKYESISPFGEYQKDWALVVKNGLCGFITSDGIEIVKPKYEGFQKGNKIKGIIGGKVENIKH